MTETKVGATASIRRIAFHSVRSPFSVRGAANSKEYDCLPDASSSRMVTDRSVRVDEVPVAMHAG